VLAKGRPGETYNVGGNDVMNVDLTQRILADLGKPLSLITPVADRAGHDRRYCLDTTKLRALGWSPQVDFAQGLHDTIAWYRKNDWWWRPIKENDPAFRAYYSAQYEQRTK
jgi:dTDP-glucose 4,6-dehydratase